MLAELALGCVTSRWKMVLSYLLLAMSTSCISESHAYQMRNIFAITTPLSPIFDVLRREFPILYVDVCLLTLTQICIHL